MKISNEQNQTFGSFCGFKSGQTVIVTGQYAVLTFHSDFSVNDDGYKLFFSFVSQGKVNDAYALFDKWKIRFTVIPILQKKNYGYKRDIQLKELGSVVSCMICALSFGSSGVKSRFLKVPKTFYTQIHM